MESMKGLILIIRTTVKEVERFKTLLRNSRKRKTTKLPHTIKTRTTTTEEILREALNIVLDPINGIIKDMTIKPVIMRKESNKPRR